MAITLTDNEFFAGLTNLALYMRLYSTVNSSKPKDFVDKFATDTLEYGNTKIFPYSEMPSVSDYSETSSLLTVTKVNTGEEILRVNDRKVIKSSYSKKILDQAFTDESGMNMFVGYLMGQMDAAKTDYLYSRIFNKLNNEAGAPLIESTHAGMFYDIELKAIDETTDTATEINAKSLYNNKKIAKFVNNLINNVEIFSTAYNHKHIKQALDLSDLRLIVNGEYDTDQVVELFATLLKSDYITESFEKPEKIVLPTSKTLTSTASGYYIFGILCHKRWYQFFYKFVFMGNFFDVSNLVVNNFLHFWTGDGYLEHLPCVIIRVIYE